MTPEMFATGILKGFTDENMPAYKEFFQRKHTETKGGDPYWTKAYDLFNSLPEGKREIFFEIIERIGVETISYILAVIDGITLVEGEKEGFKLYTETGERLDGDLQDFSSSKPLIEVKYGWVSGVEPTVLSSVSLPSHIAVRPQGLR